MKYIAFAFFVFASNVINAQSKQTAEFFVRTTDNGKFQISVNSDVIYSKSGFYRFFEVPAGRTAIVITYDGKVYKKDMILMNGIRSIAIFSKAEGLRVIAELDIYNKGHYALDNWNTPIQSEPRKVLEKKRTNNHNREMLAEDFNSLMQSYSKIAFDDERIKFLTMVLKNNRVSVEQLMLLLKKVTFDDARLSAAVSNYNNVFDREKFYLIRELFAFPSDKEKLDIFLTKQDY
ncbi:MAG: hypothetical protein JWQ25_21 [Daejeonella sp.]|nr:hypothetical protein [Daejeonella sp.]